MQDEERINPGHGGIRQIARVIGPVMIVAGGIFMAVGLIDFFSAMGTFGPPKYFWCLFVGMPLVAFGAMVTNIGFLGAFARYVAGETAPVQKDTFNYLADGIKPGVQDLAQAVSEGISAGRHSQPAAGSRFCPACGQPVATQAKFCSGCGQKME